MLLRYFSFIRSARQIPAGILFCQTPFNVCRPDPISVVCLISPARQRSAASIRFAFLESARHTKSLESFSLTRTPGGFRLSRINAGRLAKNCSTRNLHTFFSLKEWSPVTVFSPTSQIPHSSTAKLTHRDSPPGTFFNKTEIRFKYSFAFGSPLFFYLMQRRQCRIHDPMVV